jgi:hypothetical protein
MLSTRPRLEGPQFAATWPQWPHSQNHDTKACRSGWWTWPCSSNNLASVTLRFIGFPNADVFIEGVYVFRTLLFPLQNVISLSDILIWTCIYIEGCFHTVPRSCHDLFLAFGSLALNCRVQSSVLLTHHAAGTKARGGSAPLDLQPQGGPPHAAQV